MAGKLFIVSACSGAGKTTLVTEVLNRFKNSFEISRCVTYTSKVPRGNEVDGKDYCFLSVQEFEDYINKGFFLEWSHHYGNYYGTSLNLLQDLEKGKS